MRTALDVLYRLAQALAATCLVAIAGLVVLQVLFRIVDGARKAFGLDPVGLLVPSLAEICGFLLVGASFLALAATLRRGDHIRVSLMLQHMPAGLARIFEVWCLLVAVSLSAYFTWYSGAQALDSHKFHEVSIGIIPIPLVWPQSVMTFGLVVFTISLLDDLVMTLLGNKPSYESAVKGEAWEGGE